MSTIFGLSREAATQQRKKSATYGRAAKLFGTKSVLEPSTSYGFDAGTRTMSHHRLRSPAQKSASVIKESDTSVPPNARLHLGNRTNSEGSKNTDIKDVYELSSSDEEPVPAPARFVGKSHGGERDRSPAQNPRKRKRGGLSTVVSPRARPGSGDGQAADRDPPGRSSLATRALVPGKSAPAQLTTMVGETIGIGSDTALRTPPRRSIQRATSQARATSLTPKQSKLWSQLLANTPDAAPSASPLRTQEPRYVHPTLDHSSDGRDVSANGVRMVDRLKLDSQRDDFQDLSDDSLSDDVDDVGTLSKQLYQDLSQHTSQSISSQYLDTTPVAKQTYSQTRSYLQEVLTFEESLLRPLVEDEGLTRHRSDADDSEDDSQAIRSLHELRAAGIRKRFADDVAAVLDDLSDHNRTAWSRRRTAMMELCDRLDDDDFASRLVASDFLLTISKECQMVIPRDLVAETLGLCLIIRLTSSDLKRNAVEILCSNAMVETVFRHMSCRRSFSSIAADRASNMSRMSQQSYLDFIEAFRGKLLGNYKTSTLDVRQLAGKALTMIFTRLRRSGQCQSLMTTEILDEVMGSLNKACEHETGIVEAQFDRCLALEMLIPESMNMAIETEPTVIKDRDIHLIVANFIGRPWRGTEREHDEMALWLQLFVNITNKQAHNCDAMVTSTAMSIVVSLLLEDNLFSIVSTDDEVKTGFGVLVLALGLLINLAEQSDIARKGLSAHSTIDSLTRSFVAGQREADDAQSLEQGSLHVAYGYLAVLLCNLCVDDEVRTDIRALLPANDLSVLIRKVEEFIELNRQIDVAGEEQEDEGREEWSDFTARLGSILDKLR